MSQATDSSPQDSDVAGAARPDFSSGDPLYTDPYVDVDEWRDEPERHRYVHGGFRDTDLRFSMYFPPAERYEGRFYHPVMHISGNENAARGSLGRHGRRLDRIRLRQRRLHGGVEHGLSSTCAGRATSRTFAEVRRRREYSRVLAQEMYGGGRPYGYVYGGSGGGFKSTACVENAKSVWDGAVPFITGARSRFRMSSACRLTRCASSRASSRASSTHLEPGGSGDMYAGLNEEERAALEEVTRLGFPPRAWFAHQRLSVNYTGVFASLMPDLVLNDPRILRGLLAGPGYLGANPPESLDARANPTRRDGYANNHHRPGARVGSSRSRSRPEREPTLWPESNCRASPRAASRAAI